MFNTQDIAGIVLAGGRSRRMGQNKALLNFNGKALVQHMMDILSEAGLLNVFVSGSLDGFPCIPDSQPWSGPAQAMEDVWKKTPQYRAYLFVPVDMPFLEPSLLLLLLESQYSTYFENSIFPVYLVAPFVDFHADSVRALMDGQKAKSLPVPEIYAPCFQNLNTPDEWKKAVNSI